MKNYFPAILFFQDSYQFNTIKDLNEEIFHLEFEAPTSKLLSEMKSYRTDVLFLAENFTTDELLKNIMSAWRNYYKAQQFQSTSWMNVFEKEICSFSFFFKS